MVKLSVVLATFNEEKNIGACLDSIKDIADEIIIVDGTSSDKTVEIAKRYGARVSVVPNQKIFHINKQKAVDMAKNEWVLQLDADELVSPALAEEIIKVISMPEKEIEEYQDRIPNKKLFLQHQRLLNERDGLIGSQEGPYNAFFIPRLNYFMGKYLRFGGVYPDGVIRLIKKKYSYFPCKSVHEQIIVKGRVGWLQEDLIHMADPTFKRYLDRNNRYIDLIAREFKEEGLKKNSINAIRYGFILPVWWFVLTFGRHKGFLDGWQGFVFSLFSALRFPRAYSRYIKNN